MAGAVAKHSAAQTTDELVVATASGLMGFWAAETAGATAELILRDTAVTTDTTAPILARIKLPANDSRGLSMSPVAVRVNAGILVDRVSGTSAITVYVL